MFSKAYEIASNFTHPVFILTRDFNKNVNGGIGTFVFLNPEGWFITAAHIFDIYFKHQQDQQLIQQYYSTIAGIEMDSSLSETEKKIAKNQVNFDGNWLTHHSFWWGFDGLNCEVFHLLKENDLAIGKFANFNPNLIKQYPVLKDPSSLKLGTSLCKLGFPFHEVKATFDENLNQFRVAEGVLPIPRFPLDGIFTRVASGGKTANDEFEIKYIETSTPGLKGQSGGPIFDVNGNIWAIQSMTMHISLGFSPKVINDGIETTEHQFLNIGLGVHVETICKFLNKHKVKYYLRN